MPKYRNTRTGEVVEQPGDGLTEFYLSRGWELVGEEGLVDVLADVTSSAWRELLDDEVDDEPAAKSKKGKGQ